MVMARAMLSEPVRDIEITENQGKLGVDIRKYTYINGALRWGCDSKFSAKNPKICPYPPLLKELFDSK